MRTLSEMVAAIPACVSALLEGDPEDWQGRSTPGAALCGGAVRDLNHGKPVKDWDIVIGGMSAASVAEVYDGLVWLGGYDVTIAARNSVEEVKQDDSLYLQCTSSEDFEGYRACMRGCMLHGVIKLTHRATGTNIDLLLYDKPFEHVVEKFPHDLCKVYLAFNGTYWTMSEYPAYTRAVVSGTARFTRYEGYHGSAHQIRVAEKYPEYTHLPYEDA